MGPQRLAQGYTWPLCSQEPATRIHNAAWNIKTRKWYNPVVIPVNASIKPVSISSPQPHANSSCHYTTVNIAGFQGLFPAKTAFHPGVTSLHNSWPDPQLRAGFTHPDSNLLSLAARWGQGDVQNPLSFAQKETLGLTAPTVKVCDRFSRTGGIVPGQDHFNRSLYPLF